MVYAERGTIPPLPPFPKCSAIPVLLLALSSLATLTAQKNL
jgi:hypothetical protein